MISNSVKDYWLFITEGGGGEGVGFFRGGGTEKGLATSLTEYKGEL